MFNEKIDESKKNIWDLKLVKIKKSLRKLEIFKSIGRNFDDWI
jgi:hypothetical protein